MTQRQRKASKQPRSPRDETKRNETKRHEAERHKPNQAKRDRTKPNKKTTQKKRKRTTRAKRNERTEKKQNETKRNKRAHQKKQNACGGFSGKHKICCYSCFRIILFGFGAKPPQRVQNSILILKMEGCGPTNAKRSLNIKCF